MNQVHNPNLVPCHVTYSIVASDPGTGELGVAVQSQAFNTRAAVPWHEMGAAFEQTTGTFA